MAANGNLGKVQSQVTIDFVSCFSLGFGQNCIFKIKKVASRGKSVRIISSLTMNVNDHLN